MHAFDQGKLQRWTFLVLFVGISWLFWLVARPLWVPIFLGALIAIGANPLHKKLIGHMRGKRREAISAALITSVVLLVGLVLTALLSVVMLRQVLGMARSFSARTLVETPNQMLGPRLSALLASVGENPVRLQQHLTTASSALAERLAESATGVLSASAEALLIIIFTGITAYYLLRNGSRFAAWFVSLLPLPDGEGWELVLNFRDVARVMLLGTGVTALFQAVSSCIGYWGAGVPHPLVWGVATGCASILPAIGSTLIWLPVVIWLFATDHVGMSIAVFIWSNAITVGIADYVIRPRLLGKKVKMNELLVFIALFGGIEAFGLLGTILGPIIAALLMAMIHIYQRDYRPQPQPPPQPPPSTPST